MRKGGLLFIILTMVMACTSIDCPLNNIVYTAYTLQKADGTVDTLKDTLTVFTIQHTPEHDPVLLNKAVDLTSFNLPISYANDEDVLYFMYTYPDMDILIDTVIIRKENRQHFEAIDCTPSYFHTLTGVAYTQNLIDSIVINNREVNYDATKEHFHIYFKHRH